MLCSYSIEKLLGLKGVIVKKVEQTKTSTVIEIEMELKTHHCPDCGAATRTVHDYRCQTVKDIPAYGKPVLLIIRKRRYRCPQCGKRFQEKNTFLPRYHRMTNRLAAYVLTKPGEVCSFTSVTRQMNLSVSTVIRIFDLVQYMPSTLPRVVSIDEFKGNTGSQKYQCILTDPVNHCIVDILPSREKYHLITYFKQFVRSHVTHFVSDMWSTYADISNTFFNQAVFVIDKYHFVRQVIWAFEAVRKEVQGTLSPYRRKYFKRSRSLLNKRYQYLSQEQKQQVDIMLYASERLLAAYSLKEKFLQLLAPQSAESAKKLLSSWVLLAGNSKIPRFEACAKTIINWSAGILNALDCGYTNGFTERCNNKIKVLKRNAYGYRNFNRFRNRILHILQYKEDEVG